MNPVGILRGEPDLYKFVTSAGIPVIFMTQGARRLIFYGLVLVFIFIAPATILYATGYSFDWEKRQLVKTGAFYFKSLPKGAQIFINGELKDTTPAFIDRLLPHQYLIEISKDGFWPWKKNLSIQSLSGTETPLVTEARNILLIPKNPEISLVLNNATSTLDYLLSPEEKAAFYQASTTATSTLKDVASWTLFENSIYYLQKSNLILYKTDINGTSKAQISFQSLPMTEKTYQIKVSKAEIAIWEPQGTLYLLNPETKIFEAIANEIDGAEFSSDNKKLLYWNSHEIFVLWLKEVLVQPYRKAGDKELITRFANKIAQAIWFSETNEHIIFVVRDETDADQIKITELDGRDLRNTYDIYSGKISEIYYNQNDDLLYFLTDRKLYSLDLLTK